MKVLIVKTSALGDVVHSLPVLAWLKSADPAMQIDWLVEEGFAPLLEGHPLLTKLHRIATRSWRRRGWLVAVREAWQAALRIRREHYDVVLDLQGNSKSGLFTLLSGAARRYGFAGNWAREWPNLLAANRRVALSAAEHHISERSLAIARAAFPLGQSHQTAGPLPVNPGAARRVAALLDESGLGSCPFVVLHYGTTWTTKLWAIENWQELLRRLATDGRLRTVLTWGGGDEREVVEKLAATVPGQAMVWPRGTLPELVALLARARVVVGGDTGPVHIAAAVGTPTVSLYRVTDNERNGPRGDRHLRFQAPLTCSPCLRKACPDDPACAQSIGADAIYESILELARL